MLRELLRRQKKRKLRENASTDLFLLGILRWRPEQWRELKTINPPLRRRTSHYKVVCLSINKNQQQFFSSSHYQSRSIYRHSTFPRITLRIPQNFSIIKTILVCWLLYYRLSPNILLHSVLQSKQILESTVLQEHG